MFGLLSPVSEMSIFNVPPQKVIQRCESRPRIFFSASRKMLANRSLRCDIHRPNWAHRESQSSSLLSRLSSYLVPRCLVVLEFWLLLNEQVYCNALVDTIHVHMQRHTLSLPIHWHIFALTYIRNAFTLICACVCLCHVSIDVLM